MNQHATPSQVDHGDVEQTPTTTSTVEQTLGNDANFASSLGSKKKQRMEKKKAKQQSWAEQALAEERLAYRFKNLQKSAEITIPEGLKDRQQQQALMSWIDGLTKLNESREQAIEEAFETLKYTKDHFASVLEVKDRVKALEDQATATRSSFMSRKYIDLQKKYDTQQVEFETQRATLETQQAKLDVQAAKLDVQQAKLNALEAKLADVQETCVIIGDLMMEDSTEPAGQGVQSHSHHHAPEPSQSQTAPSSRQAYGQTPERGHYPSHWRSRGRGRGRGRGDRGGRGGRGG